MASSSHLKPGEKGKITAKINIKDRSGTISKNIQVFSNDPKRSVVTLSIHAIIQR
jgi:ACT domain-containing protein